MKFSFRNVYTLRCYRIDGSLKWEATITNLVTDQGLNNAIAIFSSGWFCGLVTTAGFAAFAAGDTAAKITTSAPSGGTNGWAEFNFYSGGLRPALILGTITGGAADNSASLASYGITQDGNLKGGFIASSAVLGGTAGLLFGEGPFDDGMTHAVTNGETITMQVNISAVSA